MSSARLGFVGDCVWPNSSSCCNGTAGCGGGAAAAWPLPAVPVCFGAGIRTRSAGVIFPRMSTIVGNTTMILLGQALVSSPKAPRRVRLFVLLSTNPRFSLVNQTTSFSSSFRPLPTTSTVTALIRNFFSAFRSSALRYLDLSNSDARRTISPSFKFELLLIIRSSAGTGTTPPSFAVALANPSLGCDRQIERPGRLACLEPSEFFCAAEPLRHFTGDFVVDVQRDRIAGSLDSEHRLGQQVAGDAGNDVLGPDATVGAGAVAAVLELASCVVGKHTM